jgi:rare lipoprotein A
MSGKHKVMQGRHRAVRLVGKHRRPAPGLNALSDRTGMLAVTGAVAASTTLGGAMGMSEKLPGAAVREPTAGDAPGQARAADRADRGAGRTGVPPAATAASPAQPPAGAAPVPTATRAPQVRAGATRTPPASRSGQRKAATGSENAERRAEPRRVAEPPEPSREAEPAGQPGTGPVRSCRASFYSEGQLTASGERFDPDELTAAHKSLPFGTRVRVTNPETGESVVVRINDRGPFVGGRCLDLSRAAFDDIADPDSGVIPVRFQIL